MRPFQFILILFLLLVPMWASAGAPPFVPVQGVLADADGIPVDGEVEVRFALYGGSGNDPALWSETQTITVASGLFSAYLGQDTTLSHALFRDNGNLMLGITVGQDQEMPRIYLGSTPFSGYAEYSTDSDTLAGLSCDNGQVAKWNVVEWECADDTDTDSDTDTLAGLDCLTNQVARYNGSAWECADETSQPSLPSGAVVFFNLADCPPGYSELTQANGRYLVGRGTGALGATAGTALTDQENRAVGSHSHTASAAPHSHALGLYNYSYDNHGGMHVHQDGDSGDTALSSATADVNVTIGETGSVGGTPAPYLQLTACVKD